jgi:hypothetical protein
MTEEEAHAKLLMLGYPPERNNVAGKPMYMVEGLYTMSPFEDWAVGSIDADVPAKCPHIIDPDSQWWGWPTMALMLEDLLRYLEEQRCTQ